MIPEPNLDQYVFVIVLENIDNFAFDQDELIQLKKDEIYLFPYNKITLLSKQNIVKLL